MAREFASRGANVSVAARSADALHSLAADIGGHAFPVDLTDQHVVDGLIGRVEGEAGPIDVLVNNAGLETTRPLNQVDPQTVRAVSRLNLETPMVLTQNVLGGMLERNHGHLLFTSSVAATAGFPGLAAYCGTKAGITNFATTVGMELKNTNINTTVIAPGPVDTPMWNNLEESDDLAAMVKRLRVLQLIPSRSAEEIARLAVDAVADNKAYIGLPRRLTSNHVMRNMPSRLLGVVLKGVPVGPQRGTD